VECSLGKVLVVDDEPLIAIYMAMTLEAHGFSVTMARDGEDGLRKARGENPDLIITDFLMPRMDGWKMIAELRACGIYTPVIISSANPEHQFHDKNLYQGYLAKPFDNADLIGLLKTVLDKVD
jgi:DNA-binding response OmpR family regulator